MPKFACRCGNVLNLSKGWTDYELLLVPIHVVDDMTELLDTDARPTGEQVWDSMFDASTKVFRCDQCGRLHLEHERNKFTSYIKEV